MRFKLQKILLYTKENRYIFSFFIIFTILVLATYWYFLNKTQEEYLTSSLDSYSSVLNSKLKSEEMDTLSIALLISKNQAIKDALICEDEESGYETLSSTTKIVEQNTGRYIKAQIITDEKNIFARSWDNIYAGMPLGDYREDLDYFLTNKTPRASIEVGRRIGIKATVPIYNNDKLIGFVEVIDFFESLTQYFTNMGIDLYILMDNSYLDVAILMQNNLMIDDMVISNINHNPSSIQLLKNVDFKKLKSEKIKNIDDKYLIYNTMRDGNLENIGGFVMVIPKEHLDYFQKSNSDISFLLNITKSGLYSILKQKNNSGGFDKSIDGASMVALRDIVPDEDRYMFDEDVQEKLKSYSKDDLIKILLEKKLVKRIEGEIR